MSNLPGFIERRMKATRLHDQFLLDFRGLGLTSEPREAGILAIDLLIKNVEREYLEELKKSLEDRAK